MRLREGTCLVGAVWLLGGCALIGWGEDDGALADGVAVADGLAIDGIEAVRAALPRVRWAGPSSTLQQCGGDFPIASYGVNGSLQGRGLTEDAVATAWESAGLEVERDDGDVAVTRGPAVMTFLVVPAAVGPDVGRFAVDVECTSTPRDEIDELDTTAPRDFGDELGLPLIPGFD